MWDPDRPDRLIYTGDDYRTRFGIDVSAYQNRASANNTIDWEAAKADGVEFAMVRIGLRGYGSGSIMEDAFYAQNIDGAMAAGIETGVYFFAQAITVEEAIEEADFVISLLEGHEIDGPVAYDWEMHDSTYRVYGTTPEMATACAVAFCERIEEAGYDAMVYAGQYVSYIKYDQGALEPYLLVPRVQERELRASVPHPVLSHGLLAVFQQVLCGRYRRQRGCEPPVHPAVSPSLQKEIRRGVCPAVWRFPGELLAVFLLGLVLVLLAVLTVLLLLSLAGIALVLVVAVAHQDTSFRLLEYMA